MAKEDKDAKAPSAEAIEESQRQEPVKAASQNTSPITWFILAAVIVAGSTGGFALSKLVSGPIPANANGQQNSGPAADPLDAILASEQQGQASWLFEEMEPVLANLDEPGVSRYVRVLVSLEVSPELDQEKGNLFLTDRKVILRDWLTTYFAGLSLEDVRGSRNHTRIKEEVQDQFNQILFPNSRPFIRRVLFKEFAVQ